MVWADVVLSSLYINILRLSARSSWWSTQTQRILKSYYGFSITLYKCTELWYFSIFLAASVTFDTLRAMLCHGARYKQGHVKFLGPNAPARLALYFCDDRTKLTESMMQKFWKLLMNLDGRHYHLVTSTVWYRVWLLPFWIMRYVPHNPKRKKHVYMRRTC